MSGICTEDSLGAGRFAEGWPFSESILVLCQVPSSCTVNPEASSQKEAIQGRGEENYIKN